MAGTLTVQNLQGPSSGANANKIIVPSGQTLDVSGGTLTPSAGAVVQTLNDTTPASVQTYTSSTFTDIGLSVSITPTATSSKVLILYTVPVFVEGTNYSAAGGGFRLYRDSTNIEDPQGDGGGALGNWLNMNAYGSGAGYWDYFLTHTSNVVDSPNTTSSITYSVKYSHRQGVSTRIGYNSSQYYPRGRMTVMEIAQ